MGLVVAIRHRTERALRRELDGHEAAGTMECNNHNMRNPSRHICHCLRGMRSGIRSGMRRHT